LDLCWHKVGLQNGVQIVRSCVDHDDDVHDDAGRVLKDFSYDKF